MIPKNISKTTYMDKTKLIALVTGGTGYIGYNLCLYLAKRDIKIVLIKRLGGENKRVPFHKNIKIVEYEENLDFLKEVFDLHKINIVIHLASLSSKSDTIEIIRLFQKVNVDLTSQILNIVKNRRNFLGFINIGSIWQLDNSNNTYNFVYTIFKQFQEELIKFFSITYEFNSLSLLIVDSYGPDDWRPKVLNSIINGYLNLKPMSIENPNNKINFVHINDILEGIYMSIEEVINQKEYFTRYCLKSENNINVLDLSRIIESFYKNNMSNIESIIENSNQIDVNNINTLPGWSPSISFIQGLSEIIQSKRR